MVITLVYMPPFLAVQRMRGNSNGRIVHPCGKEGGRQGRKGGRWERGAQTITAKFLSSSLPLLTFSEVEIMCGHRSNSVCFITMTDHKKCQWSVDMTDHSQWRQDEAGNNKKLHLKYVTFCDSLSSIVCSVCRFTAHFHERQHAMSSSYRLFHRCILCRLYWFFLTISSLKQVHFKPSGCTTQSNQHYCVVDFCACTSG